MSPMSLLPSGENFVCVCTSVNIVFMVYIIPYARKNGKRQRYSFPIFGEKRRFLRENV